MKIIPAISNQLSAISHTRPIREIALGLLGNVILWGAVMLLYAAWDMLGGR
ncbi:MAG: hypothetical protein HZB62_10620 [Nitrospirae bacterium]|nr:hypothetical protein [Nitrospirota bacterium]